MNQNLKNSAQALLAMQRMSWEQGVAAQAFFEYGRPDIGMLMVREALRRSDGKGLLGITNPAMDSVDCGANGLPLYYAYQYTGDRAYWAALQRLADWLEFSAILPLMVLYAFFQKYFIASVATSGMKD